MQIVSRRLQRRPSHWRSSAKRRGRGPRLERAIHHPGLRKQPVSGLRNPHITSSTDLRRSRSPASCRVALFEFLNLDLCLFFRVIHGLTDVLPSLGGLLGRGFLVRFVDLFRGVLGIAPGFLHSTFGLLDHPFVGQFFAANTFSDALLHFAHCLIDLASHLILIHEFLLYFVGCGSSECGLRPVTPACGFPLPSFSRRVVSRERRQQSFSSFWLRF